MNNISEYVVFSILAIVGLLCIVWSQSLVLNSGLKPFLDVVASTLLIGGMLGGLYKKFVDGAHFDEIRRLLGIHESVRESGLLEFHPKASEYNFAKLITESKELTVVVNDGLSWIKHNASDLRERFDKDTKTVFMKLSPDSLYIPPLAQKVSYNVGDYKSKLDTAKTELIKLFDESEKAGVLEIYRLKNYPTYSIYLTESVLVITPYQISSKRLNVPVFVFCAKNNTLGFCKDLATDMLCIIEESEQVFPPNTKPEK